MAHKNQRFFFLTFFYLCMKFMYTYIYSVLFFLHNCPLLIPFHNTSVLIKICRFLINVEKIYANPYEIGPSNASQGQHSRKDATEQMNNLTVAWI